MNKQIPFRSNLFILFFGFAFSFGWLLLNQMNSSSFYSIQFQPPHSPPPQRQKREKVERETNKERGGEEERKKSFLRLTPKTQKNNPRKKQRAACSDFYSYLTIFAFPFRDLDSSFHNGTLFYFIYFLF